MPKHDVVMMSTEVMNLKICVSRSREIIGAAELDTPVGRKARTVAKIRQDIPKLKDLQPFPKDVIPRGYTFNGFGTFGDGGAPGYSENVYEFSKIEEDELKNIEK